MIDPTPHIDPRTETGMRPYLDSIQHILDHGVRRGDRTATGTLVIRENSVRDDPM